MSGKRRRSSTTQNGEDTEVIKKIQFDASRYRSPFFPACPVEVALTQAKLSPENGLSADAIVETVYKNAESDGFLAYFFCSYPKMITAEKLFDGILQTRTNATTARTKTRCLIVLTKWI